MIGIQLTHPSTSAADDPNTDVDDVTRKNFYTDGIHAMPDGLGINAEVPSPPPPPSTGTAELGETGP
ncbi:hypothetical protein [Candidatus Frankia alpina]|uniref:hypothetical protein n=2 Tax=Candidatus Frankia alpina TaxID=2699483 RepID=UPI0013D69011|nr:hypothetical protein [Candidatus Frankia alpina]